MSAFRVMPQRVCVCVKRREKIDTGERDVCVRVRAF
jgi:hypothetical protein